MSSRRIPFLCAVLFLAAAPVRSGGPISEPAVWNERGLRSYRDGKFHNAILCFETAAAALPADETIRFNLASSHAREALRIAQDGASVDGYETAVREAKQAIAIDDGIPFFYKVLGFVHQENGVFMEAHRAYREAARLDPEDADAWALSGDTAYRLDLQEEAIRCWESAVRLDPERSELCRRIDKAGREGELEDGYREARSPHFRITYDAGYPDARALVGGMLDALEEARRRVHRELGRFGEQTVSGVAYPPGDFRRLMEGHGWTRGLYDGKIRVPFPESGEVDRAFRETATHEYTHVVVFEWVGNRCPAWLNEGLAQNVAGEWTAARSRAAGRIAAVSGFLPLEGLEDSFLDLPESLVEVAYLESYLVVAHIRTAYTGRHMSRLLDRIGDGTPPEQAVREVLHRDYTQLLEQALAPYQGAVSAR
ncbi:MAG: hypothetical protein JW958_14815 [Candidatus Eisenbacteria bacterium]|nr:hypothetical protein [Candidatus Eisenbacteria bacterium]